MNETRALETVDLKCSLGGKLILDDVTLSVACGEFVSLIGPNGAGKTTLLKCLMKILQYDGGEVRVNGVHLGSLGQKDLARNVAYVPQADSRYLPFRVEEFIMTGRYPHLSPFTVLSDTDRAAVEEAMRVTGTGEFAERRMEGLSGGERQMVMIAGAVSQGARILLLDEPVAFLDPGHERRVMRLLKDLNSIYGTTIFMVTHNLNRAILTSGRVIVLDNGRIEYSGPAADITSSGVLEKVYGIEFEYSRHPEAGCDIIMPDVIADEC
jgi:iron complex transport system ATP-binding protein